MEGKGAPVKLRNPALALDVETIGIGPDGDKPAALCPWTARIVSVAMLLVQEKRALWLYDGTLVDVTGDVPDTNTARCEGEADLVRKCSATMDKRLPGGSLVTFNGRGYDLPVLLAAAARNGLPANRLALRYMYAKRWDDDPLHLDLCEIMAFSGASTKPTLKAACVGLGLADPKAETAGNHVADLVAARNGNALREYNLGDVHALAGLCEKLSDWFD